VVNVSRAVDVTITDDAALASASVDPGVGALAAQAFAGDVSIDADLYWREGNNEGMLATFASGIETLTLLEGRYQLPEVAERREALEASVVEYEALVVGSQYAKERMLNTTFQGSHDCF